MRKQIIIDQGEEDQSVHKTSIGLKRKTTIQYMTEKTTHFNPQVLVQRVNF